MPAPAHRRVTPMWLAHHWPEDYDRCIRIGHSHICRRCIVLYPVALMVTVLLVVTGMLSGWATAVAVVVLPLPAVVDFVAEHLGLLAPSSRRLVVATVLARVGLGAGFARYLDRLADPVFWAAVVVYGGVCLAAALHRTRRG